MRVPVFLFVAIVGVTFVALMSDSPPAILTSSLFKQPVETYPFFPKHEIVVADNPQTLPNTGMVVFKVTMGGGNGTLFAVIAPNSFKAKVGERIKLIVFETKHNGVYGSSLQYILMPKE
jgi:hypothetical protein